MKLSWYVIIHRPNGTIKAIGPLADNREAIAYKKFMELVDGEDIYTVAKDMYAINRWGAPAYPFQTDQYDDEG